MSFALTFGGFGDFVCLTQLILGTCKILIESYDATEQSNSLVEYITGFNNALECLRPLIGGGPYAFLPGGARLAPSATNALSNAIGVCERDISAFHRRLVVFRDSDDRSFKARLGVFGQRLRWTLSLSKAAAQLRTTLAEQKNIIEIVLAASLAQQQSYSHSGNRLRIGYEPAANGVTLVDMMDQIVQVPIQFCFSFEIFSEFLRLLFTNRAGTTYVHTNRYRLTVDNNRGFGAADVIHEATPQNWHHYVGHNVVLEMAALGVRTCALRLPSMQVCPTCGTAAVTGKTTYRCTYCQTAVSFKELIVWEKEKQTVDAETNKDWGLMRRIHFDVKKHVVEEGAQCSDHPTGIRRRVSSESLVEVLPIKEKRKSFTTRTSPNHGPGRKNGILNTPPGMRYTIEESSGKLHRSRRLQVARPIRTH